MTSWTSDDIRSWVDSQEWYQRIPVAADITTSGSTDSVQRLNLLNLPDLSGQSVLDIGCNSGMYCFECKRKNAAHVVGIDLQENRLQQARTLADIMDLNVDFLQTDLFSIRTLGEFDVVLCFAVLTEITDLIEALSLLKDITQRTLYLELAIFGAPGHGPRSFLSWLGVRGLQLLAPTGIARMRKHDAGWSIAPTLLFLESFMGDKFEMEDLGMSVRYRLLKFTAKS